MTTLEGCTLAIASVGAVLGVMNTWRNFRNDRVKLRVTPFHFQPVAVAGLPRPTGRDAKPRISIEVLNLSTFPVTISQVGLMLSGSLPVGAIFDPQTMDGSKLPRRLEPRESFSVLFQPEEFNRPEFLRVRHAFAKTACGVVAKGNSEALKSHVRSACQRALAESSDESSNS